MSKISNVSRIIKILLIIMAVIQISALISLLGWGNYSDGQYQLNNESGLLSLFVHHQLNNGWQSIAFELEADNINSLIILGFVQLIPYLLIYIFLYKLFGLYQQGHIFTLANSQCLKNVGKTLLGWIVLNLIYPVLVTLIVRFGGWSDTLAIHVNLGSTELFYLVLGLIIYVIAWIMGQGIKLKQEQELVI